MADRSIVVRLRAEVNDFVREMGRASGSLDDLVKKSGDSAGVADTALGRMVQSARLQRDEWTRVGASALAVGTAWTAFNVAVAKTGVEYNMLQQTSRAALRTLMGGAQEANAQMDKLDAFARTSPFSKAVFIQAQQQMLGFGIEAKKVIPYLSAINEAVAATGGSNQDIAELTRIFSQVQAAAKITAVDLMQFGQRGVNAAELIGSQMGKTGAEIRAEITAGSLDAGVALDALAAGMQERFAGASANIKDTMAGALDRVSAAWRDLSSSIMEGAVGKDGGGWLVGLTNSLADALRFIERMPDPMKQTAGVMSGLGGAALVVGGSFAVSLPRILDWWDAMRGLAATHPKVASSLGALGKAAGIAGAALATLAVVSVLDEDMRRAAVEASGLADAVQRLGGTATDLRSISAALPKFSVDGQALAMNDLADAYARMTQLVESGGERFGKSAKAIRDYRAVFEELDKTLASMDPAESAVAFAKLSDELRGAGASTSDLVELFPSYAAAIRGAAETNGDYGLSVERVAALMRDGVPAIDAVADAQLDNAAATKEAAAAAKDQRKELESLWDSLLKVTSGALDLRAAEANFLAAVDDVTKSVKENGRTLDIHTEKGRANQRALDDIAGAGMKVVDALVAQQAPAADVEAAMQRTRDQYIKAAGAMGMSKDEAVRLADKLGLIPRDVRTTYELLSDRAESDIARIQSALRKLPREVVTNIITRQTGSITTGAYAVSPSRAAGGFIGGYAAGGSPRWTRPGYVSGPGTSTSDSVPAWLSRDEFVTRASSAQYYGPTVMHAINEAAVPREWFSAIGLASGGSPRGQVYSSPSTPSLGALTLDSSGLAPVIEAGLRRGLAGARFYLDGREVAVRIGFDDLALRAHAAGRGI